MQNKHDEKVIGLILGGISLSPNADEQDACAAAAAELKRAGVNPAQLRFQICKKSVDARKKRDVRLVYSVSVRRTDGAPMRIPSHCRLTVSPLYERKLEIEQGSERVAFPPLVVGMGPAGLFCALLLAENGYSPILIDRGDSVDERCRVYEQFVRTGRLDTESNIQYGAGGAGTFSDGKLLTRTNDSRIGYVLERFCEFGAPKEILTAAKPHIGTDILVEVVQNMIDRIESLGGTVRYRCRLESMDERADGSVCVLTNAGEIMCSSVILAIGHSARDTYAMLIKSGYAVEPKPFSVGVRIEHLQEAIDRSMYGDFAGHPNLGHGEYHLSDTTSGRGVYTFCMCPGGQVVAAASEEGGVVVNGMSCYARDGRNANSAVCVSVRPEDHGGTPESAISFQRTLEKNAYVAGGGDYSAPIQTVGDFLNEVHGSAPGVVEPTYRNGHVRLASMDDILPPFVCRELRHGLRSFERKLEGFSVDHAILSGVETRTSSPVRLLRTEQMTAFGKDRIYPCGEGAGYAGGITSAAVDGIRAAQQIMKRFAPLAEKECKD